jgi:glycosyltransferase involved in cell wall biosynthesis
MPQKVTKILFLNQMAGPLFRELAEDLSGRFSGVSILKTGHPDTLKIGSATDKLLIDAQPAYNRESYFTRVLSWLKYTLFVVIAMFKVDKQTAIFIVSNPPLLGPAAWLVNKIRGVPYIVLVYDMHPDTMVSFGVLKESSVITQIWRWMNRLVWNNALAVYTLGPVMVENLAKQFNVEQTQLGYVGMIPPWADTDKIKPIPKADNPLAKELKQQDKITVLYSGNMGLSHDIDSILLAAKILSDETTISFLLIGEGAKWQDAVDFQIKHPLVNLQVLPFQPEEKLPYTMPLADIALVSLDVGAEGLMIPSKMFYYMAAGSAVLGICSGRNDVSEVLNSCGGGITVEPQQPEKLALAIKELANNPEKLSQLKRSARTAAVTNYSRKACMNAMSVSVLQMLDSDG